MAANEYYNTRPSQPHYYNGYDDDPHHGSATPAPSTYPPSYATHAPQTHADQPSAVSPFQTPFDDHVYPANSHNAPDAMSSQHSFAQDTRYHSPGPGNVSPVGDDIPLRQHPDGTNKMGTPGYAMDSTDHVYDTTANGPPARDRSGGKGGVRFGELGMLGSGKRRIPIFVYLFSVIQIAVFIGELVKAAQLTGSPIQTQPSFNPMIGPSSYVLINMGSRYVICMHRVQNVTNYDGRGNISWPCPWSTTNDATSADNQCTLSQLCGFGDVPNPPTANATVPFDEAPFPNQWWRFITPIFLHAGIVHIGFNLLMQLTLGKEIERAIGSIRFFLVYMSSGIFGFVMGGNFAAVGISSTGASGALFGIIALTLLDLLYSWKERQNPVRELMFILLEVVISFVLGLLPGLDNFSHIGGFLMGLCLGVCVLHSPNFLRHKIGEDHFTGPSYSTVSPHNGITSVAFPPFLRNPVGFFKGRKSLWWVWWMLRAGFLVAIIVIFIVLLNNFYTYQNTCSWCKYLSCLPVNGWCDQNSPFSS
ncbi:putative Rhomboid-like protein [Seiridium cardinale]|uniref:Rhomboid-type serine protease n=1 Tax=Seiridium cardinale TaxID=138064 RepID=A0ABR2XZG1_9PEZI